MAQAGFPDAQLSSWLSQQWGLLLGTGATAGDDADFFALGGSSLLAMRLVGRMRKLGYTGVGIGDLLECRTLREQHELLRGQPLQEAVPAPAGAGQGLVSLSQRNRLEMAGERLRAGQPDPPFPLQHVVRLDGAPVDVHALDKAARDLLDRHAALRTRLLDDSGAIAVEELPVAPDWHIEVRDVRALAPQDAWDEVISAAGQRANTAFDYRHPPLIALQIGLITDTQSVLTITVDHLVSDGPSMTVLWNDLTRLYLAATEGRAAELPPVTLSVQEFLARRDEERLARGPRLLAAWDEELAGYPFPPLADLVPARPDEEFTPPQPAVRQEWKVPADVAARFSRSCLEVKATEHAAVMGLFSAALHLLDGRADVVVCSAHSGRDSDSEALVVGWLSNQVLARLRPTAPGPLRAAPLSTFAAHAQERLIFAYRHPVPFHTLIRRYQGLVGRRSPRNPYIYFDYVDHRGDGRAFGSASASPVEPHVETTSFPGPAIAVERDDEGIVITISSVAGRYPAGLVDQLGTALARLVTSFADDPLTPVDRAAP